MLPPFDHFCLHGFARADPSLVDGLKVLEIIDAMERFIGLLVCSAAPEAYTKPRSAAHRAAVG
jgi:hypothetical protein